MALTVVWRQRFAYGLLVFAFGFGIARVETLSQRESRDICRSLQQAYDSRIEFARFLGRELDATPARIDESVERLRRELGPRPGC